MSSPPENPLAPGDGRLSEEDVLKLDERYEYVYRRALAARSPEEIRECIREVSVILQYLPSNTHAKELSAVLRKAERERRGLRASPKLDTDPRRRLLPIPVGNIILLAAATLAVALFVAFLIRPNPTPKFAVCESENRVTYTTLQQLQQAKSQEDAKAICLAVRDVPGSYEGPDPKGNIDFYSGRMLENLQVWCHCKLATSAARK